MRSLIVFVSLILYSCSAVIQVSQSPVIPTQKFILDSRPTKVLLFNTYNVAKEKFRDNKKEMFTGFIDSVMNESAYELEKRGIEAQVIRGYTAVDNGSDSGIYSLLNSHKASHAIVINNFNVYFSQTNVEVKKTATGKEREAFYDIVSDINFSLYNHQQLVSNQPMEARRYHSSRSVMSGLLAAGPNIVIQRKDAWQITKANLYNYLNSLYPNK